MSRQELSRYRPLFPGLLVVASIAFSLGFACAAPLAAFGAVAALTLPRRSALQWTAAAWFANQIVGYGLLHYPWTANSFEWGVGLLAAALCGALAAELMVAGSRHAGRIGAALAGFAAAFVAYEATLFVLAWSFLGGTENYTGAIIVEVLEINAVAFVGLLALNGLGSRIGLVTPPLSARHA